VTTARMPGRHTYIPNEKRATHEAFRFILTCLFSLLSALAIVGGTAIFYA
jgi:nitrate reductase NapE component